MLYDNALLARAYLHGWQVTGEPLFEQVARETLDWALREMRAPEGGFYSALDADSEGVEGKFYVWTLDELREVLGDGRRRGDRRTSAPSEQGNFEGTQHPRARGAPSRRPSCATITRAALRGARAARVARASTTSG